MDGWMDAPSGSGPAAYCLSVYHASVLWVVIARSKHKAKQARRGQAACRQRGGEWYEAAAIAEMRARHGGDAAWRIEQSLPRRELRGHAVFMLAEHAQQRRRGSGDEDRDGGSAEAGGGAASRRLGAST